MSIFTITVARVSCKWSKSAAREGQSMVCQGRVPRGAEGCGNQTSSDAGQDQNGPEQRSRTLNSNDYDNNNND